MATPVFDIKEIEKRMKNAVSVLKTEFGGLRTGRASATLLDPISVMAYGAKVPLNQVASVTVPEARMITVSVYDKSQVSAVEKAIRESGLGLNPVVEGTLLRLPIPELNQERRKDLSKQAAKYAEAARVAVRNVRRDGMDVLKKQKKDSDISEDDLRTLSTKLQDLTDKIEKEIDVALATKEQEIMQV